MPKPKREVFADRSKLVGPFVTNSFVPQSVREQPGILRLNTPAGTAMYPMKQFRNQDGQRTAVSEMQKAVLLLAVENAAGIRRSGWEQAEFLMGPRDELGGQSYAETLVARSISEDKKYATLGKLIVQVSQESDSRGINLDAVWNFILQPEFPEVLAA